MKKQTIRERRKELGYRQIDLEKMTGIRSDAISLYENRHRKPNPEHLIKIAKALQVKVWNLEIDIVLTPPNED